MSDNLLMLLEMIEEVLEEQDELLQSIENIVSSLGGEIIKTSNNRVYKIASDDRIALEKVLTPQLAALGFIWEPNAPSAGFGRYSLRRSTSEGGSLYFLMKHRTGGAAQAGAKYEVKIEEIMKELLPGYKVESAGFKHGSDLEIGDNNSSLKIELKTSSGADFGQFKIYYNIRTRKWALADTPAFRKNEPLYKGIFKSIVAPYMSNKHIDLEKYANNLNVKDGFVKGLRRAPYTGAVKRLLQAQWFDGRTDKLLPVNGDLIQTYYALKGDILIQIQGKGVYALTPQAASYFQISELKNEIKASLVRIRLKPHQSTDGPHSFTCALKIGLKKSSVDLTDDEFLVKIKQYLEGT
jgi:hypothetical protein